jgi:Taurine catabolism dioxygenase TauD, TfdA family
MNNKIFEVLTFHSFPQAVNTAVVLDWFNAHRSLGGETELSEFRPMLDEARARTELLIAAPALLDFVAQYAEKKQDGIPFVVIPKTGLASLPEHECNVWNYAIAMAIGYPTVTEPRTQTTLWDVKNRALTTSDTTFSEHNQLAEMHTDSSFKQYPEPDFTLFVRQAARCGGGRSLFTDSRVLAARLAETRHGASLLEEMQSTDVGFMTPAAFTNAGSRDSVEIQRGTIFSKKCEMRYSKNSLLRAAKHNPSDANVVNRFIQAVDGALQMEGSVVEQYHDTDTLLVVDNHFGLHGRTSFDDNARHLIRCRISDREEHSQGFAPASAED